MDRPGETMTGIFAIDVANPLFIGVETAGIKFLRKRFGYASVLDMRHLRTHYDALVLPGAAPFRKLDFKADQRFTGTGRVAWEWRLSFPDGTEKPGWGVKDLDLVFYIDPVSFHGLLVDANRQREMAREALEGRLPDGWVQFSKLNPGKYAGDGLAVPIRELEEKGAILWSGTVSIS